MDHFVVAIQVGVPANIYDDVLIDCWPVENHNIFIFIFVLSKVEWDVSLDFLTDVIDTSRPADDVLPGIVDLECQDGEVVVVVYGTSHDGNPLFVCLLQIVVEDRPLQLNLLRNPAENSK